MLNEMTRSRKMAIYFAAIILAAKLLGVDLSQIDWSGTGINVPSPAVKTEDEQLLRPTEELVTLTAPLSELFKQNKVVTLEATYFYLAFADVVARNPNGFLKTSGDFAAYNALALDYMFKNDPATGSIPGLGKAIDDILAKKISLDPGKELDNITVADLLYAIGWTAYNEL